jgi:hypothetical protein
VGIAQQELGEGWAGGASVEKPFGSDPLGRRIADLDHRSMRRSVRAKHDRNARHAFPAMNSDFHRPSAFLIRDDRGHAVLQEIDTLDRLIWIEQRRLQRKSNWLQMRLEESIIVRRQRPQKEVFRRRNGHAPAMRREERPVACAEEVGRRSIGYTGAGAG